MTAFSPRQTTVLAVLFHLAGGESAVRGVRDTGDEVIATLKPLAGDEVVVAIDRDGRVRPLTGPPG